MPVAPREVEEKARFVEKKGPVVARGQYFDRWLDLVARRWHRGNSYAKDYVIDRK
jgi:hypothetical protein